MPPAVVLASLYLAQILIPPNRLALYIQRAGSTFTADEETCRSHLQQCGIVLDEGQVSAALLYTAISRTPSYSPSIFIKCAREEVPQSFNWDIVVAHFDQPDLRVSKLQFLALYEALRPLAVDQHLDIQHLWGGNWQNSETQLSFLSAFASLSPDQLDATTIPGLRTSFTVDDLAPPELDGQGRAPQAVRHPLVSMEALSAMFHVALHASAASDTPEAKRLFQEVVVPNLDIFVVSGAGVPKPWPDLATDTIHNLFDRFLYKFDPNYDFVLESLWRKDKAWVAQRLVDAHAKAPMELLTILDHALRHNWLEDLVSIPNGFGLDLAAVAHARGSLDLDRWEEKNAPRKQDVAGPLLTFLNIKAQHELEFQREGILRSIMLPVKTIHHLLHILEEWLPKNPTHELIVVQRACITAYPRLINYGDEFDDIIDANGAASNSLPDVANGKMEEHYKRMYSDDLQVRNVVEALDRYKHSRDPLEQDIFACMIHGLFDEYALYHTYPLEALATTAVLFGGIISHKLISDLPLEIGLGMILEAVRDYPPDNSMYKFGLQALMQLFARLVEWPGFCSQLLQVPGLQGTEAWNKAEDVVRAKQEEEQQDGIHHQTNGGRSLTNGGNEEMLFVEPSLPQFSAIYVDPPPPNSEDPDEETQDKIQFVLNNITNENLETKFQELKDVINDQNQVWFAGHLVQERAKMQPNYHALYLNLVKLFQNKNLWKHVLRETYASAFRTLNSESTMTSAHDRTHLKNLAIWLGSLTLARDQPILHKNISFKQLLSEGYQTQRLIVVIPFICKVLAQGQHSLIFKPPNPWLMDILSGLMELYVKADLKLNLRFEIEVLCSDLNLDHKTIQPSDEIMNRLLPIEEPSEIMAPDSMDRYDNMSMNGLNGEMGSGRFSSQEITSSIPDLGPLLTYPPGNDMVNQSRLMEIVKSAITRAVHEIISPVVERSVTIAAISTAQMIHKDFATEPNEARVRSAAINMVKKTAGSLALVTSKEPLRASMTNYIRALSGELPQGLPEGTIIMCVNSNLDTACSQVEKKAEERAVPEIEDMIEGELEARRHHRMTRPEEPYMDVGLSRWSWTIPAPYKLQPSLTGLNQEQMAIYDEFARHPRAPPPSLPGTTHVPSSSDATRSMANEILQDPYQGISNLPTPAEQPARPHVNAQQPTYSQAHSAVTNGRVAATAPMDTRTLVERVSSKLNELSHAAMAATEHHYADLPRPSDVLECLDGLYSLIIRFSQGPEAFDVVIIDQICQVLFSGLDQELVVESLVHVLENSCRIGGRTASRISVVIAMQPGDSLLHVPLAVSLIKAGMIEWQRIDLETSRAILSRRDGSLQFLSSLMDAVLLNDHPIALHGDFARSLEVAWGWIEEDPALEIGQELKLKLTSSGVPAALGRNADDRLTARQDQMEYVFEEWIHLSVNTNASEKAVPNFISQMYNRQIINSRDDLCLFLRLSIDFAVERYEQHIQNDSSSTDAYIPIDALAKLITTLVKGHDQEGEVKNDKAAYLKLTLSIVVLVLNHHHVMRGEHFNQRVFFRLFSVMLCEFATYSDELSELERQEILLVFASKLIDLRPSHFPGFLFGWLGLVSHRHFLPPLMGLADQVGWAPLSDIVETLMSYVGELLKPLQTPPVTKMIYRAVLKLILILQHDFPEFLAANQSKLSANIPSHCIQLHSLVLNATPGPYNKAPDLLQPGLKIDRVEEMRQAPDSSNDIEVALRQSGLLEVLDQALASGPSEDAVAHIAHAIQQKKGRQSGAGFVPVNADLQLIRSLVVYVGRHSIARAELKGGPNFVAASPDVALLSMLVHELRPEPRYFFLSTIVEQLRAPNAYTHYFSQALLEMFGGDLTDPEETDIRQQVTRILLERLIGQWPQPWGLVVTIIELVKNEKYMFFELPFIKNNPEVIAPQDRFYRDKTDIICLGG
jgi:CCR4-NOT transcription complex subunit 1